VTSRCKRRRIDYKCQRQRGILADGDGGQTLADWVGFVCGVNLTSISLILVSRSAIWRPSRAAVSLASDGFCQRSRQPIWLPR
jgi:hypothetical protein